MFISENIAKIKASLPNFVTFIAVSKTKPISDIKEAYDVGVRDFGENKVQEFLDKYEALPKDICWHFIGHLQTNKVKYLCKKVSLIHSLDSIKLLKEIEKQYKKVNEKVNVLIEINIGREESKSGLLKEDLDLLLDEVSKCSFVEVKGLMAIIPPGNEEQCKLYFRQMKGIFDELKTKNLKNVEMKFLSMGMSSDYKYAIDEGSNMIRVGQGVFGKRLYNKEEEKCQEK